jgi:hypothetical protein
MKLKVIRLENIQEIKAELKNVPDTEINLLAGIVSILEETVVPVSACEGELLRK